MVLQVRKKIRPGKTGQREKSAGLKVRLGDAIIRHQLEVGVSNKRFFGEDESQL